VIRDRTAFALGLIALFGVVYAIVARYALDAFPYSGDEYSVVLQAELFARGFLKAVGPEHAAWLRIDHVLVDSFVRSKYPPGASAILSLGVRAGYPWLVAPCEGVAILTLVWHSVRRVLGARPALTALVVLGASPLFIFDSASFYSHASTMLCLAVAFAAVTAWSITQRTAWLALVGIAIGAAFLVRPTDALLFGLAMLVFWSWRAVVVPALCAVPFVAISLWYQARVFGSPFTDGYHAYEPTLTAIYGPSMAAHPLSWHHLVSATQWWNHIDIFSQICLQWTIPGTVIAALFGVFAIDATDAGARMRRFSIAVVAVFCIALLVMISDPDDGPHTRYLSVTLIPIALLAANGLGPLCDAIRGTFGTIVQRVFVVLAILFGLAQLGSYLQDRIPKQWKREGLYEVAADVPRDAIVIVRAQYPTRYARNGPFFDGVLYLSVSPETSADEVARAYVGRPIYEAHEGIPWTIERVR
jgi:4-amino-4-deoxy-L-arabinose transferase-like glycosyltransferase